MHPIPNCLYSFSPSGSNNQRTKMVSHKNNPVCTKCCVKTKQKVRSWLFANILCQMQSAKRICSVHPARCCWVCLFFLSCCLQCESIPNFFCLVFTPGQPLTHSKCSQCERPIPAATFFCCRGITSSDWLSTRHSRGLKPIIFPFQRCMGWVGRLHVSQNNVNA